tara:strand:+ start:445 stop:663 length:219 start_codon:yes stop_codon:yes gene_type:complete
MVKKTPKQIAAIKKAKNKNNHTKLADLIQRMDAEDEKILEKLMRDGMSEREALDEYLRYLVHPIGSYEGPWG